MTTTNNIYILHYKQDGTNSRNKNKNTCNIFFRCPTYPTPLAKECKLVTKPTDPCCQEPQCDIPSYLTNMTGTISPNMIPTLAPQGQITGHANTPAPTPGIGGNTPVPVPISKCT